MQISAASFVQAAIRRDTKSQECFFLSQRILAKKYTSLSYIILFPYIMLLRKVKK